MKRFSNDLLTAANFVSLFSTVNNILLKYNFRVLSSAELITRKSS